MNSLERYWYSRNPVATALWPLGLLFSGLVVLRRQLYSWGLLKPQRVGVPVIVVGNLTVGGTGKTPLVIHLVELLRNAGYRPGIISRGYGGNSPTWPRFVTPDSNPEEVGDEPVLLAQRCRCPILVDPDRVAATRALLSQHDCDVIVADDGLQHYRLARDIEIAVLDGQRRFGNGACLPAGPLREPPSRLRGVDFVISNGAAQVGEYLMTLTGERAVNLKDPNVTCHLSHFRHELVRAVAGIGHPQRFFDDLRRHSLRIVETAFPDHHPYTPTELDFKDALPILMTEKDAVKCRNWAKEWYWYVPVTAQLDALLEQQLLARLSRVSSSKA